MNGHIILLENTAVKFLVELQPLPCPIYPFCWEMRWQMRSRRCFPISHICYVVTVGIQFLSFGWKKPLRIDTIQKFSQVCSISSGEGKVGENILEWRENWTERSDILLPHLKLALKDVKTEFLDLNDNKKYFYLYLLR